ncbi:hypothetical protein [Cryobacterium algoritolerans]|uniref:hypothetical protein n=1 Tax=Cryobacterium algoritolerans TaxID=1259184 RepID=UPI001F546E0E|nr:hypothetical protein [Cryobacterium algoritolerans]
MSTSNDENWVPQWSTQGRLLDTEEISRLEYNTGFARGELTGSILASLQEATTSPR